MKKLLILAILLLVLGIAIGPKPSQAFNSATHLYIAEKVFRYCLDKTDLNYGSIAPDLAMYADPSKWKTAFDDTHYNYIDLTHDAWRLVQRPFAKGWLTHNEKEPWGADHYAHIDPGYVTTRAEHLRQLYPGLLTSEFAHDVIETAIDLLLKRNNDLLLGQKLLEANLFRSSDDLNLLLKVLASANGPTDPVTLSSAELTFRNLVNQYALALGLPRPLDEEALAALGVQLAQGMGIQVTKEKLLEILHHALTLCKDYKPAIDAVIQGIKKAMPSPFCLE